MNKIGHSIHASYSSEPVWNRYVEDWPYANDWRIRPVLEVFFRLARKLIGSCSTQQELRHKQFEALFDRLEQGLKHRTSARKIKQMIEL